MAKITWNPISSAFSHS